MKRIIGLLIITFFLLSLGGVIAQHKTENLVIVTLDGMRWQELFNGADPFILTDKRFTKDSNGTASKFWNDTLMVRRKKLFPFIWSTIEKNGQIFGNRLFGNEVNNANPYKFSYPGYNEIFTGYPDSTVNSNDKILNKHTNVLEFLNKQQSFSGKVAAFSTWDVFPYILNKWRSRIYVNADTDSLKFTDVNLKLINDIQFLTAKPIDVRPDVLTYMAAREYMKVYKPKALYIAFDEIDAYAHSGEYDQYLKSAHAEDAMIADISQYIQSTPGYKDHTTLVITSDHGRGGAKLEEWCDHGEKIIDAGHIWMAVMGPDTPPKGEIKKAQVLYQKQFAATFVAILGFTFTAEHPVAPPIESIYK
jgi:Type I phosphodiesterase / nucleotide pyrophosphatase